MHRTGRTACPVGCASRSRTPCPASGGRREVAWMVEFGEAEREMTFSKDTYA
jgi:hypothetical protein